MSTGIRRLLIASAISAGIVGLLSILDMIMQVPFAGSIMMDVMFLISSLLILYMVRQCFQELR